MQLCLKICSGMANSVDPDQTALSETWFALFAYVILSETLGHLRHGKSFYDFVVVLFFGGLFLVGGGGGGMVCCCFLGFFFFFFLFFFLLVQQVFLEIPGAGQK